MKLVLHNLLTGEESPLPEYTNLKLVADGWFIDVTLEESGICLRSGGAVCGSGAMRIRPESGNAIVVSTNADVEREIHAGALRLVEVEKANRKFARKSGYGRKSKR